jgi:hypothetical protein
MIREAILAEWVENVHTAVGGVPTMQYLKSADHGSDLPWQIAPGGKE